jgi:hypothetical protein
MDQQSAEQGGAGVQPAEVLPRAARPALQSAPIGRLDSKTAKLTYLNLPGSLNSVSWITTRPEPAERIRQREATFASAERMNPMKDCFYHAFSVDEREDLLREREQFFGRHLLHEGTRKSHAYAPAGAQLQGRVSWSTTSRPVTPRRRNRDPGRCRRQRKARPPSTRQAAAAGSGQRCVPVRVAYRSRLRG